MVPKQVKTVLKRTPAYSIWSKLRERRVLREWQAQGNPVPPPKEYKRAMIRQYAKRFGIRTLVETGTHYGDTVFAVLPHFDRIYSIELGDELYRRAVEHFKGQPRVTLLHGDSAERLPVVLNELHSSALFWLDAHYSFGDTACGNLYSPIMVELNQIFAHPTKTHVILIDDARDFSGRDGYPTLAHLETFIHTQHPSARFLLEFDIIRITPA